MARRSRASHNAVVVLSMRMLPDVPSSVAIKALRRWAGELQAHGGRMIVAGVTPAAERILERGGLDDVLGADGIVPATDQVFGALDTAVATGPGVDRRPARSRRLFAAVI